MPGWWDRLSGFTLTEMEERAAEVNSAETDLKDVRRQLELFDVPLWGYLMEILEDEENRAVDAMIGAPLDQIEAARARLKLVRHLARLPQQLEAERARLDQELQTLHREDPYD